jgi:hypothetical protein
LPWQPLSLPLLPLYLALVAGIARLLLIAPVPRRRMVEWLWITRIWLLKILIRLLLVQWL